MLNTWEVQRIEMLKSLVMILNTIQVTINLRLRLKKELWIIGEQQELGLIEKLRKEERVSKAYEGI